MRDDTHSNSDEMRFLDANVFLRYLTRDDQVKADACFRLFQSLQRGEEVATSSESVVAEVVYVLRAKAHYNLSPEEIAGRLRPLLSIKGLKLSNKRTYLRALDIYSTSSFLDFEDALTFAHMEQMGIKLLVSYDTDFDRVSGVAREEP